MGSFVPSNDTNMSIPLNPIALEAPSSIRTLADAHAWIERFARPDGFNTHAWFTLKRLALTVWRCRFEQRPFPRTLNYLHPLFYEMIRTPEGVLLVPERTVRRPRD